MKFALLAALCFSLTSGSLYAFDAAKEFQMKCAICHKIGGGKLVGPDLKGVTKKRKKDWIINFIMKPDEMVKTDPEAKKLFKEFNNVPMTNYKLTKEQATALYEYIKSQDK